MRRAGFCRHAFWQENYMTKDPDSLLIVDDDAMVRDLMLRYFSRFGFNVFSEGSGKNALEWIDSHHVDLVLLDIEMPGMSGLDVLQTLRKTYTPEQLPVIMVTGRASSDDIETALAAGANDYVTKPINFPSLIARIQIQLSRKQATVSRRQAPHFSGIKSKDATDSTDFTDF
jgi:DNA-binding response OmpR family regulator